MKKITVKWLKKYNACCSDEEMKQAENINDIFKIIDELKKTNRLNDINWLLSRYLNKKQRVQYAVFAAKQVIHIFEEKYPNDKRPRQAIEAAKKYIKNQTKKNAADAYAVAAYAAAAYAYAAADAAAYADAYAAYAYAAAAYAAAAYAADVAAYAATDADAAKNKMKLKIINYGIKLLKELK